MAGPNDLPAGSYLDAVKARLAELAAMPGAAATQLQQRLQSGSPLNPMNRPGMVEAMGGQAQMTPEQLAARKQAIAQALLQKQQQEQLQMQIQQGQRQAPTAGNPAGIQF